MKNNNKINTAVIYTRYSPRRLDKGQKCDSCETQEELSRGYCDFHKLEVIGVFSDEGISGKTRWNRPGLNDALVLVRKTKAILVVYSFSRLSRSVREMLEISESIRKAGGGLASLHENIDTNTLMGQCMFTIVAAFAELQRKQTGELTSEAMRQHQRRGRRMSKHCPYGWKPDPKNDKRMVKDKYEQANLEIMIRMRKEKQSYSIIAKYLEFKNRKPRTGGEWNLGNLGYVLRREMSEQEPL